MEVFFCHCRQISQTPQSMNNEGILCRMIKCRYAEEKNKSGSSINIREKSSLILIDASLSSSWNFIYIWYCSAAKNIFFIRKKQKLEMLSFFFFFHFGVGRINRSMFWEHLGDTPKMVHMHYRFHFLYCWKCFHRGICCWTF